ncbi:MAG: hypothetical protein WCX22_04690 [Methanoregula sp.]
MADFSYICKNLIGTAPTKGHESGAPACTRHLETGTFCTADTAEGAVAGKAQCPSADYLKILAIRKRKFPRE